MRRARPLAWSSVLVLAACSTAPESGAERAVNSADVAARLAKFAPVEIAADVSRLPDSERAALEHLVAAARLMDPIFLRQAWAENPAIEATLTGPARELFRIHYGPWDRTDSEPFVGDLPRPPGAGFYPPDLTAAEFERFLAEHPERRDALASLTTVVRRQGDALVAVPYSEAYAEWLAPAAEHLRAAAELTASPTLAAFLRARAEAFLTDDYYASDMAWMDVEGPIEITIGPYETYEDRLMGLKAAFEAFVTVADPEESRRLALYKSELPAMEANLPIPDAMKNPNRGAESPIRVVDVVLSTGDTRSGVQTIAYNLPNDERVREAKGSKKVLLRNVLHAKFERILRPIAERMLTADQAEHVAADAFANQTLFHELSHGLGPGRIVKDGRETEVRLELKELYSPLEEAKADMMGVWNQLFMIERGLLPDAVRASLYPTWLAGLFRSMRFGAEEAHGLANVLQFNYVREHGAITRDADGRYAVEPAAFEKALRGFVHDVLVLQAEGDSEGTQRFFDRYGALDATLQDDLLRLVDLPVDIRPIYEADAD